MELSYIFFKKFFLYFGKGIFRTLACLELEAYSESETYSEHCQTSTMKCFAKNSYLALFPASALNFFPKKPTLKNFLIFPETETPKKFLIFQETETLKTSHISGSNFPSSKNKKNPLWKNFLYFWKRNFLAMSLANFLYFRREVAEPENKKLHIFCFLRENFSKISSKEKGFL